MMNSSDLNQLLRLKPFVRSVECEITICNSRFVQFMSLITNTLLTFSNHSTAHYLKTTKLFDI